MSETGLEEAMGMRSAETVLVPENPSPLAINALNSVYYGSCPEAFDGGGVATFYNRPEIQTAIARTIEEKAGRGDAIRVKEIMAGSNTDKVRALAQGFSSDSNVEIVVTDFSTNSLPTVDNIPNLNVTVRGEQLNIFSPLPELPPEQRVDAMIASYGFDSVWLPGDTRLVKRSGTWYQSNYQIEVPVDDPDLVNAIRSGSSASEISLSRFAGVGVVETESPVEISSVPFGAEVEARYDVARNRHSVPYVNIPGGLISKVQEAFDTQLKPDGIFIIGDTAVDDPRGFEGFSPETGDFSAPKVMGIEPTGMVARYKTEDWGVAREVLENKGFAVEVQTVNEFTASAGVAMERVPASQKIMIISKNQSNTRQS